MSNVLIVYAHPEARSFNAAMLALAIRTLESLGDVVRLSNLYDMGFQPVVSAADFKNRQRVDRLDYFDEQKHAYASGSFAQDIQAEIDKVRWCELLILQFPLYWFSMPAILKGWIDRVFVPGFAFGAGKWYERGGFSGKRAMLVTTLSAYPEMMAPDGLNGLMDVYLWPIQNGVLAFCGCEVLAPFVAYSVPHLDEAGRSALLGAYEGRLRGLRDETPVSYHRRDEFDRRWKMKPEIDARTIGHFFGRVPREVLARLLESARSATKKD